MTPLSTMAQEVGHALAPLDRPRLERLVAARHRPRAIASRGCAALRRPRASWRGAAHDHLRTPRRLAALRRRAPDRGPLPDRAGPRGGGWRAVAVHVLAAGLRDVRARWPLPVLT